MPCTAATCIVLTFLFEPEAFAELRTRIFLRIAGVAAMIAIMVASELMMVQLTSAVAFNVAGQLHNIPIVLGGVVFFDETVHPFSIVGFALCIIGALVYTNERRAAAAAGNHGSAVPQDEADGSFVGGAT